MAEATGSGASLANSDPPQPQGRTLQLRELPFKDIDPAAIKLPDLKNYLQDKTYYRNNTRNMTLALARAPMRSLSVREGKAISWKRDEHIEAVLVFLTGQREKMPCRYCANGGGTFTQCVTAGRDIAKGACANCHYTKGTRCDFHIGQTSGPYADDDYAPSQENEDPPRRSSIRGTDKKHLSTSRNNPFELSDDEDDDDNDGDDDEDEDDIILTRPRTKGLEPFWDDKNSSSSTHKKRKAAESPAASPQAGRQQKHTILDIDLGFGNGFGGSGSGGGDVLASSPVAPAAPPAPAPAPAPLRARATAPSPASATASTSASAYTSSRVVPLPTSAPAPAPAPAPVPAPILAPMPAGPPTEERQTYNFTLSVDFTPTEARRVSRFLRGLAERLDDVAFEKGR